MRDRRGALDLLEAGVTYAEGDVVEDRGVEEDGLLIDIAHQSAQLVQRDLADVDAVDGDAPLYDVVEARDEVDQRGLT